MITRLGIFFLLSSVSISHLFLTKSLVFPFNILINGFAIHSKAMAFKWNSECWHWKSWEKWFFHSSIDSDDWLGSSAGPIIWGIGNESGLRRGFKGIELSRGFMSMIHIHKIFTGGSTIFFLLINQERPLLFLTPLLIVGSKHRFNIQRGKKPE